MTREFSVKDEIITKSGRIGKIVSSIHQEGETSRYRILWNDNPNFIDEVEGSDDIHHYQMPPAQYVELPFYRYFAGMFVKWD